MGRNPPVTGVSGTCPEVPWAVEADPYATAGVFLAAAPQSVTIHLLSTLRREDISGAASSIPRELALAPTPGAAPRAGRLPGHRRRLCRRGGVTIAEVRGGSRRRIVARARTAVASHLGVTELGLPIEQLPRAARVFPSPFARTLRAGLSSSGRAASPRHRW